MLEGLRGLPVSSWEGDAALAEICRNPPPGLRELLARTLAEVFPERAGKDLKLSARMDNALADCAGFYFFTDPLRSLSGLEKSALRSKALLYRYPRRILREIDCLNLARGPWPHPASGREERRSFPEIYRDAAEAAAAALAPVFGAYLETGVFPPGEASRAIGNGGLSVTDEEGKPRAPRRAAPLPLHEILELHEF
jgi:hypothetical protein